jgi:hypothetical protein
MEKQTTPRCTSRPKAGQYKIKNWSEYNRSLINRGSITLWFSPDVKLMHEDGDEPKIRGGQKQYTDEYIEMCCMIRKLFSLGFRQTQGTVSSIVKMLGLKAGVPCYTQMCRRMKQLNINADFKKRIEKGERIDIVVDSSGLKVYGEGEWKVRQHGWSQHRTWRKIHVGVNPDTDEILCHELTPNSMNDADLVEPLLQQVPEEIEINAMMGDGIYDKHKVYNALRKRKIKPVIPPRKGAKIVQHGNSRGTMHARDKNLRYIRKHGNKKWKKVHHYHKRNKAETAMFRIKTIFSDRLQSRTIERQKVEMAIVCKMLNRMAYCGMPITEKVTQKAA